MFIYMLSCRYKCHKYKEHSSENVPIKTVNPLKLPWISFLHISDIFIQGLTQQLSVTDFNFKCYLLRGDHYCVILISVQIPLLKKKKEKHQKQSVKCQFLSAIFVSLKCVCLFLHIKKYTTPFVNARFYLTNLFLKVQIWSQVPTAECAYIY